MHLTRGEAALAEAREEKAASAMLGKSAPQTPLPASFSRGGVPFTPHDASITSATLSFCNNDLLSSPAAKGSSPASGTRGRLSMKGSPLLMKRSRESMSPGGDARCSLFEGMDGNGAFSVASTV